MKKHLLFLTLILSVAFRPDNARELTFWVNSYQIDCVGIGPMNCLLVHQGDELDQGNWTNLYAPIDKFNYQAGYFYKVRVVQEVTKKAGMAAGESATHYTLLEVLEKVPDERFTLEGNWEFKELCNQPLSKYCDEETATTPALNISIPQMSYYGTDGYNAFHGSIVRLANDSLAFGPPSYTRMPYPDKIIPEFVNLAFSNTQRFEVDNGVLRLYSAAGGEVAEFSQVTIPTARLHNTWTVERILGRYVYSTTEHRMEFDPDEMQAKSVNGDQIQINQLTELDNESIRFARIADANQSSPDISYANFLNRVLPAVSKYRITGPTLNLMNEHDRILVTLKRTDL